MIDAALTLREHLLAALTNPDLAVLCLILGCLLVYLEFNLPGTVLPGALGTLSILLAVFALSRMPVRLSAVLLLAAAAVLILLEAKLASHGILALAGTLALVFGLFRLIDGPTAESRVHLGTALGAGLGFGAISFALAWIALRARRAKLLLGPQAMIGGAGIARTALAPQGQISIRGELWRATLAPGATLPAGAPVRVCAVDGLLLTVEPTGGMARTG